MEDQKIEASFHYPLSTQHCIHNQVYSLATLCLWFPSRAALKLCFINSCTVVPTHSCSMNNSYSPTERREPKINTNTDRAAFGHRPCLFVFVFASFSLTPSFSVSYVRVCALVLRTVSLVVLVLLDIVYHCLHCDRTNLATKQKFLPVATWLQMNTVFLLFRPAVWLWDNHLSDCGRRAYSPAVRLRSDHLLHEAAPPPLQPSTPSPFPLPLLISQPFFLSFSAFFLLLSPSILFSGGGCHSSNKPHLWGVSSHW